MNYFELYPGDYQRDTGALTLAQHGAFLLLLMTYYSTEKPLPSDNPTLFRIARAMTPDEQSAVLFVADLFFPVSDVDGLRHNDRAEADIAKARIRIESARNNGNKGGRPPKPKENPVGSDPVIKTETQGVTGTKAHQTPHAIHHKDQDQNISPPIGVDVKTNGFDHSKPALAKASKSEVPFVKIVELYHEKLPMLPAVEKLTNKRRGYIRQRWADELPSLDAWANYFADVSKSRFLIGQVPSRDDRPPFRANLEWLCKPTHFVDIAEGKYHR